jgi:hypothetical protein
VSWRLASSFPRSLDTIFGSAGKSARTVKDLSGGRFEVSVHAGGELMPPFGVVHARQNNTIEMAPTASCHSRKIHADIRALQRDQLLWERFSGYRYDGYMSVLTL